MLHEILKKQHFLHGKVFRKGLKLAQSQRIIQSFGLQTKRKQA